MKKNEHNLIEMLVSVAEFHIMTKGEWMEMIDVIQDCFAFNKL